MEMDDFEALLETLDFVEQTEYSLQQEVVLLPKQEFDPIRHVAQIIQGKGSEMRFSGDHYPNLLVAHYLLDHFDNYDAGVYIDGKIGLREAIFLDVLREVGVSVSVSEKLNLNEARRELGSVISYFVSKGYDVGGVNSDKVGKEVLNYGAVLPEERVVASKVLGNIVNCSKRIKQVTNNSEIKDLLAIEYLFDFTESSLIKKMIEDDSISTRSVFLYSFFSKEGEYSLDEIQRFDRLWSFTHNITKRFSEQAEVIKSLKFDYKDLVHNIAFEIEKETGIIIRLPQKVNDLKDYHEFRESLVKKVIDGYELFPSGEFNSRAILRNKLDGSIGYISGGCLDGNHFYPLGEDDYKHITEEDVEFLKKRHSNVFEEVQIGDKVEIVDSGSKYRYTKDGSWGYVERISEDTYSISFHEMTGAPNNPTLKKWDIKRKYIKKVIQDDNFEEIIVQEKDLLERVETIAKRCESQVSKAIANKNRLINTTARELGLVGIEDHVIAFFIKDKMVEVDNFSEDIFTRLNKLGNGVQYVELPKKIISSINEEMGFYFNYKTSVYCPKSYQEFKEKLPEMILRGYKMTQWNGDRQKEDLVITFRTNGEDKGHYSDGTSIGKIPIGTIGRLDRDLDFVPLGIGSYFRLQKQEMRKIKRAFPDLINEGDISVGQKVIVTKREVSNHWNDTYLKERNKNYPAGTYGIVEHVISRTKLRIRFEYDGEWSRDWRDDGKHNVASYAVEELDILKDEGHEKLREETLLGINSKLKEIFYAKETEFNSILDERANLAKRAIPQFLILGYLRKEVNALFVNRLDYTYDLVERAVIKKVE